MIKNSFAFVNFHHSNELFLSKNIQDFSPSQPAFYVHMPHFDTQILAETIEELHVITDQFMGKLQYKSLTNRVSDCYSPINLWITPLRSKKCFKSGQIIMSIWSSIRELSKSSKS